MGILIPGLTPRPFSAQLFVEWTLGEFACKAGEFCTVVAVYASTFTMAAIALDRLVPG